ncbi:AEC family transporter [Jeotgalibaca ciconiae]|uniref:AEC family transporter n=1 Tax=Jeotgalibaca ciconiae TaxID=2496265 RepID=A0A3S9H827_9LACT|nr:AEC family transporter [Jeotgalibaca ciconiae]AZP03484.1 AEC family transporter [Jeotgalibaca ciconiae]HJB23273.1 AEC family transporter [Candidatus Jeotgalibaca pullicola]
MDPRVVLHQMLVLMLILVVGYIVAKTGVLEKHANLNFATLINYVTVPALIISSTSGAAKVGSKFDSIFVLIMAVFSYVLFIGLALITPKIFKVQPDEEGIIQFLTVFANNGFMGFPVVQAIFGTGALFYASIYNIPNNLLLYSIGIYMITKGKRLNTISWRVILTNPATIASVLALFFFFFDIQLPSILTQATESLGNITSPLAMFLIGSSMADIDLLAAIRNVKLYLFAVFRMLLIPILLWFVLRNFISNEMILGVLIVIAAMPGPTMAVTLSTQYSGNTKLATGYVFLSTVISVLTIPLISILFR